MLEAGGAVLFDPRKGDFEAPATAFLIVDANGVDGYQAGQDYLIALQAMTGRIGVEDFI